MRYAMSLPVATTISGMDSLAVLKQNLAVACNFKPMEPAEMEALRDRCRAFAADGRYERFKTTKFYDGDVSGSSTVIRLRRRCRSRALGGNRRRPREWPGNLRPAVRE